MQPAVAMSVQQEEPEGLYVEHQYMCSECHQLFNTLEEVLVHQQSHTGSEEVEMGAAEPGDGGELEDGESHYQCLECGALLRNPEELLLHQEMHMREAGLEGEHGEGRGAGPCVCLCRCVNVCVCVCVCVWAHLQFTLESLVQSLG